MQCLRSPEMRRPPSFPVRMQSRSMTFRSPVRAQPWVASGQSGIAPPGDASDPSPTVQTMALVHALEFSEQLQQCFCLLSALVESLPCHGLIEQSAAPGSSLDDKEPLVAAWTRSALAASERVRRGAGRGTHPTRTGYRALHRLSCVIQRDRARTQSSRRARHKTCSQRGCQPCVAEPGAIGGVRRCPGCRCHRRCQQSRAPDVAVSVPSHRSFT
jgi:hypothetical protein